MSFFSAPTLDDHVVYMVHADGHIAGVATFPAGVDIHFAAPAGASVAVGATTTFVYLPVFGAHDEAPALIGAS